METNKSIDKGWTTKGNSKRPNGMMSKYREKGRDLSKEFVEQENIHEGDAGYSNRKDVVQQEEKEIKRHGRKKLKTGKNERHDHAN